RRRKAHAPVAWPLLPRRCASGRPPAMEVMHWPPAAANGKSDTCRKRLMDVFLGLTHRVRQTKPARQSGGDGGGKRTAGAVVVIGLEARQGKAPRLDAIEEDVNAVLTPAMATLDQRRARTSGDERMGL